MGRPILCVNYLSLYLRTYSSQLGWFIDILFRLTRYSFPTSSIYSLTKSLIQSLAPAFFSIIAFVFGMVTVVSTAWTHQCVFLHKLNSRTPIDIIQVPIRINTLQRLSGTYHKLRRSVSYHVSYFSSSDNLDALTHLGSLPCTWTPKCSKWD